MQLNLQLRMFPEFLILDIRVTGLHVFNACHTNNVHNLKPPVIPTIEGCILLTKVMMCSVPFSKVSSFKLLPFCNIKCGVFLNFPLSC